MPVAIHSAGESPAVELYFETFGSVTDDPVLLLINGLGSQSINYPQAWCEQFVAEGFGVIRFDNRDTGLSTKLDDQEYSLSDMAADAVAVLDANGIDAAHVMGLSMGGMIAQRMAIGHRDRLLSMTSVMSRTGEPGFGESTDKAIGALLRPPATNRQEYIDGLITSLGIYGSKPEWIDEEAMRERFGEAFDRCFCPGGVARQIHAITSDGSRSEALSQIDLPVLVMHGSRDTLVQPDGGKQTAAVIPNAKFVLIDGMGHDYPEAVWDRWVAEWSEFVGAI